MRTPKDLEAYRQSQLAAIPENTPEQLAAARDYLSRHAPDLLETLALTAP